MKTFQTALICFWIGMVSSVISAKETLKATFPGAAPPALKFSAPGRESGLSAGVAYCIIQDHRGFIWVATENGLSKYDGRRITNFRHIPGDSTTISNNTVRVIFEDSRNRLWIGTGNGLNLLIEATPGSAGSTSRQRFLWFKHDPNYSQSLSNNDVRDIVEDGVGNLWIGTTRGLNRLVEPAAAQSRPKKFHFENFLHDSLNAGSLSNNNITRMLPDKFDTQTVWIGTLGGGLNRLNTHDESFRAYQIDKKNTRAISSNYVMGLHQDERGRLWIGTYRGGLNLFDARNDRFYHYKSTPGDPFSLPNDRVYAIREDAYGRLWIGTFGGGVALLQPPDTPAPDHPARLSARFIRYQHDERRLNSLPNDFVRNLFIDRAGNLWAATNQGVSKCDLKPAKFTHVKRDPHQKNSLGDNTVLAIRESRAGDLWIGHARGLDRIDKQGDFHHYKIDHRNPASPGGFVDAIAEAPGGSIWLGTFGGGLYRLDPQKNRLIQFQHAPENPAGLPSSRVTNLHFDRRGHLWIATPAGLCKLDAAAIPARDIDLQIHKFQIFTADSSSAAFSSNRITCIYEDREGMLWIGSMNGLNRFNPSTGKTTLFISADAGGGSGLSHSAIYAILQDPKNAATMWIGTENGLNKLQWREEISADTPPTITRYFEGDGLPGSYICAILDDNDGRLWIATHRGICKMDDRLAAGQKFRGYTLNDGLQSLKFFENGGFKSAAGELFFGGINGFNRFFPDRVRDNPYPPPVVITAFKKFDRQVLDAAGLAQIKQLVLNANDRFFSFELAALDFTNPSGNQYAYQMQGFDEGWNVVGNRYHVSYTNLNPGKYLFRVKAANNDGVWNETGVSLPIIIRPPYWQTWWFRLLAAGACLGLLWLAYQYRVKRLLELERMRVRIASDLHDDVGSTLTKISLYSDIIRNGGDPGNEQSLVRRIGEMSRELVTNMSDIVWSIDARNDSVGDLLDRMRDFAFSMLSPRQIDVKFEIIGLDDAKKLPADIRQNLYLVFKEAITNIARHAEARQVEVQLHNEKKQFTMRIYDNGRGFDVEQASRGHGLRNMNMRAGRIHGQLKLENQRGTSVIITAKGL